MKYIDIIKRNRTLSVQMKGRRYRVGIIANVTVAHIKDILELELREEGINAEVIIGDYDSIAQDSFKFAKFDAVIIFWEAVNFVNGIHNKAEILTPVEYEALAVKLESEISFVLKNLKNTPLVLINKFSAYGFDMNSLEVSVLSELCSRLNSLVQAQKFENHIIVNTDQILMQIGRSLSIDDRQFQYTKSLYRFDFFKAYSIKIKPAFLSLLGRAKKILVLDCDNTLWGGVVGEDGSEGILMSGSDPKSMAFSEVQSLIKGFHKEGVLLALCSKNNSTDVEDIFRHHQDMVLKDDDLVAKKINWNNKVSNLVDLSRELNIGLDSFVFIDDSSFEIELVKQALPEVVCFQVPKELSEYPGMIREIKPMFFNLSKTEEDSKRTLLYLQENNRKIKSREFRTMTDYLVSLGLELAIKTNSEVPTARVAQLTQKTNQFNLTTKRYAEPDIRAMIEDRNFDVYSFELKDRFGEYGTTGVAIIKLDNTDEFITAILDSFLISCRVIGRDVEYQFFSEIVKNLKASKVRRLFSKYSRTLKNDQVSDFYDVLSFDVTSTDEKETSYCLNLDGFITKDIPHISLIGR
ncbi:HAD-IIIC family phosphatase [Amylibacter sp.]|nr:HAD-IIIC family phosphatase [Amylibacter sp.]